tara:strand:- start:311 stop:1045 length:735 start_codon:yes stop_codon:yes gene_type:complete
MYDLSVVIPCYNEEKNLEAIVNQIKIIKKSNSDINFEFILVNDGSTDKTSTLLFELNKDKNYLFIDLKKNKGYGGSICEGLKKSSGEIISWTHSDLQCDINDIVTVYRKYKRKLLTQKCIVKGKRINRKFVDSFFSNSMAIIASIIFNKKFNEINAQPKIFSKQLLKNFLNPPSDFSLDLYLLYISKLQLYEIIEHPVEYKKRIAGVSKGGDSFLGKIKLTLRTLKYIFNLRFNYNDNNYTQSK